MNNTQNQPRYQICTRCIMDTSDPAIHFNNNGECNHCTRFYTIKKPNWHPGKLGEVTWASTIKKIIKSGTGKKYDAIIGLSGGIDSAFLALRLANSGLRILAIHIDAGWNSEIAVSNIEKLVTKLNLDLHTFVVNWPQLRELQRAFLRSGVPNQDMPQDHVFFAQLNSEARKFDIPYFLSGANIATESILPRAWGHAAMDWKHIRAIHKQFGAGEISDLPHSGLIAHYIFNRIIGFKTICPLDYMDYDKGKAKTELASAIGWADYGPKHGESRFTRFFQSYYLPVKFGYDKRRAHLSSLIVSGQISRLDAISQITAPPYNEEQIDEDIEYVCKKLRFTRAEFNDIMIAPNHTHDDYPNSKLLFRLMDSSYALLQRFGIR